MAAWSGFSVGKSVGLDGPRHVGVAGGVDGDAKAPVRTTAAQIGGIAEHWVDEEWPRVVIGSHFESNLIACLQDVMSVNGCPLSFIHRGLVRHRLVEMNFAAVDLDDEVAARIDSGL